jgi:ATP-dependent Clp protease ATP-binding subunit ClpC
MSELQTPESLNRLMGEPESRQDGAPDGALVDRIRKEPFSVVLLDEFEKAHYNVFDLFLQVFDDGRLTDRRGNTADFRHAIIIMTSNLGGALPSGTSLGFSREGNGFRSEAVERIITQTFRREFLNRIDRIVIFQPLSKDTMRGILRKELEEVTRRRGLRSRAWAVEWDDEAFEFLLMKGFTADLGARPLRRAIERYFLSPLAVAIVQHQYPEGDQFLFVRAEDDGLAVEFVDPDAPAETGTEALPEAPAPAPDASLDGPPQPLQVIVLEHRGTPAELSSLRAHFERIRCCVEDEKWAQRKTDLMNQMSLPAFWHSKERFHILGQAEYLDRIQYGLRNAGSLLERLSGSHPKPRESYPRHLVGRLAEQLYLLDSACSGVKQGWPSEAFVLLEVGKNPGISPDRSNAFARRLGDMYRQWARKRRMQMQVVEEAGGDGNRPYRLWLAVSGFGAYAILRLEEGLHLWVFADEEDSVHRRCRVRVRVIPPPAEPAGEGLEALRRQAEDALQAVPAEKLSVVRRYHESPPLVRDRVRDWRSGKLERVLEGDFDLFGHGQSS